MAGVIHRYIHVIVTLRYLVLFCTCILCMHSRVPRPNRNAPPSPLSQPKQSKQHYYTSTIAAPYHVLCHFYRVSPESRSLDLASQGFLSSKTGQLRWHFFIKQEPTGQQIPQWVPGGGVLVSPRSICRSQYICDVSSKCLHMLGWY